MEVGGCRDTVLILALGIAWDQGTKTRKTDAEIKQEIIKNPSPTIVEAAPVHTTPTGLAGDAAHATPTVG